MCTTIRKSFINVRKFRESLFIAERIMLDLDFLVNIFKSHGIDPSCSSALDIGPGNGKFTLELATIFRSVVTIDCDEAVISRLKQKVRRSEISNIEAIHCPAEDLPSLGVKCPVEFFQLTTLSRILYSMSSSPRTLYTSSATFLSSMMTSSSS